MRGPHAISIARDVAGILSEGPSRGSKEDHQWPAPIPLRDDRIESLRSDLLPGALGAFAVALSKHTETPFELAAMCALGALSASAAGKVKIQGEDGYVESSNLFLCPILESGNRKSAVLNAAILPLVSFEREERERLAPEILRAESERKTQLCVIDKLRKSLKDFDKATIAQIAEHESNLPIPPVAPVVFTSDITPERLETLLETHQGRMAVISDEGGVFDIMAGRYSGKVPNLDAYLKGHSGSPIKVHRMGRETTITEPCLSVLISPQPSILGNFDGYMRSRGLAARFLFSLPASPIGHRKLEPSPIPSSINSAYHQLIIRLLHWQPAPPLVLQLSRDSHREWKLFQRDVERQMADGERLSRLRDWGGKLPGCALRLAGLLHAARHADAPSSMPSEIQASEIATALEICATLVSHALAAFALIGEDPVISHAKRILRWLLSEKPVENTKRELFKAHYPHVFEKATDLEPSLALLAEHHLIHVREEKTGGRPTWNIDLNPALEELSR